MGRHIPHISMIQCAGGWQLDLTYWSFSQDYGFGWDSSLVLLAAGIHCSQEWEATMAHSRNSRFPGPGPRRFTSPEMPGTRRSIATRSVHKHSVLLQGQTVWRPWSPARSASSQTFFAGGVFMVPHQVNSFTRIRVITPRTNSMAAQRQIAGQCGR